jgi:hypothetical protein
VGKYVDYIIKFVKVGFVGKMLIKGTLLSCPVGLFI